MITSSGLPQGINLILSKLEPGTIQNQIFRSLVFSNLSSYGNSFIDKIIKGLGYKLSETEKEQINRIKRNIKDPRKLNTLESKNAFFNIILGDIYSKKELKSKNFSNLMIIAERITKKKQSKNNSRERLIEIILENQMLRRENLSSNLKRVFTDSLRTGFIHSFLEYGFDRIFHKQNLEGKTQSIFNIESQKNNDFIENSNKLIDFSKKENDNNKEDNNFIDRNLQEKQEKEFEEKINLIKSKIELKENNLIKLNEDYSITKERINELNIKIADENINLNNKNEFKNQLDLSKIYNDEIIKSISDIEKDILNYKEEQINYQKNLLDYLKDRIIKIEDTIKDFTKNLEIYEEKIGSVQEENRNMKNQILEFNLSEQSKNKKFNELEENIIKNDNYIQTISKENLELIKKLEKFNILKSDTIIKLRNNFEEFKMDISVLRFDRFIKLIDEGVLDNFENYKSSFEIFVKEYDKNISEKFIEFLSNVPKFFYNPTLIETNKLYENQKLLENIEKNNLLNIPKSKIYLDNTKIITILEENLSQHENKFKMTQKDITLLQLKIEENGSNNEIETQSLIDLENSSKSINTNILNILFKISQLKNENLQIIADKRDSKILEYNYIKQKINESLSEQKTDKIIELQKLENKTKEEIEDLIGQTNKLLDECSLYKNLINYREEYMKPIINKLKSTVKINFENQKTSYLNKAKNYLNFFNNEKSTEMKDDLPLIEENENSYLSNIFFSFSLFYNNIGVKENEINIVTEKELEHLKERSNSNNDLLEKNKIQNNILKNKIKYSYSEYNNYLKNEIEINENMNLQIKIYLKSFINLKKDNIKLINEEIDLSNKEINFLNQEIKILKNVGIEGLSELFDLRSKQLMLINIIKNDILENKEELKNNTDYFKKIKYMQDIKILNEDLIINESNLSELNTKINEIEFKNKNYLEVISQKEDEINKILETLKNQKLFLNTEQLQFKDLINNFPNYNNENINEINITKISFDKIYKIIFLNENENIGYNLKSLPKNLFSYLQPIITTTKTKFEDLNISFNSLINKAENIYIQSIDQLKNFSLKDNIFNIINPISENFSLLIFWINDNYNNVKSNIKNLLDSYLFQTLSKEKLIKLNDNINLKEDQLLEKYSKLVSLSNTYNTITNNIKENFTQINKNIYEYKNIDFINTGLINQDLIFKINIEELILKNNNLIENLDSLLLSINKESEEYKIILDNLLTFQNYKYNNINDEGDKLSIEESIFSNNQKLNNIIENQENFKILLNDYKQKSINISSSLQISNGGIINYITLLFKIPFIDENINSIVNSWYKSLNNINIFETFITKKNDLLNQISNYYSDLSSKILSIKDNNYLQNFTPAISSFIESLKISLYFTNPIYNKEEVEKLESIKEFYELKNEEIKKIFNQKIQLLKEFSESINKINVNKIDVNYNEDNVKLLGNEFIKIIDEVLLLNEEQIKISQDQIKFIDKQTELNNIEIPKLSQDLVNLYTQKTLIKSQLTPLNEDDIKELNKIDSNINFSHDKQSQYIDYNLKIQEQKLGLEKDILESEKLKTLISTKEYYNSSKGNILKINFLKIINAFSEKINSLTNNQIIFNLQNIFISTSDAIKNFYDYTFSTQYNEIEIQNLQDTINKLKENLLLKKTILTNDQQTSSNINPKIIIEKQSQLKKEELKILNNELKLLLMKLNNINNSKPNIEKNNKIKEEDHNEINKIQNEINKLQKEINELDKSLNVSYFEQISNYVKDFSIFDPSTFLTKFKSNKIFENIKESVSPIKNIIIYNIIPFYELIKNNLYIGFNNISSIIKLSKTKFIDSISKINNSITSSFSKLLNKINNKTKILLKELNKFSKIDIKNYFINLYKLLIKNKNVYINYFNSSIINNTEINNLKKDLNKEKLKIQNYENEINVKETSIKKFQDENYSLLKKNLNLFDFSLSLLDLFTDEKFLVSDDYKKFLNINNNLQNEIKQFTQIKQKLNAIKSLEIQINKKELIIYEEEIKKNEIIINKLKSFTFNNSFENKENEVKIKNLKNENENYVDKSKNINKNILLLSESININIISIKDFIDYLITQNYYISLLVLPENKNNNNIDTNINKPKNKIIEEGNFINYIDKSNELKIVPQIGNNNIDENKNILETELEDEEEINLDNSIYENKDTSTINNENQNEEENEEENEEDLNIHVDVNLNPIINLNQNEPEINDKNQNEIKTKTLEEENIVEEENIKVLIDSIKKQKLEFKNGLDKKIGDINFYLIGNNLQLNSQQNINSNKLIDVKKSFDNVNEKIEKNKLKINEIKNEIDELKENIDKNIKLFLEKEFEIKYSIMKNNLFKYNNDELKNIQNLIKSDEETMKQKLSEIKKIYEEKEKLNKNKINTGEELIVIQEYEINNINKIEIENKLLINVLETSNTYLSTARVDLNELELTINNNENDKYMFELINDKIKNQKIYIKDLELIIKKCEKFIKSKSLNLEQFYIDSNDKLKDEINYLKSLNFLKNEVLELEILINKRKEYLEEFTKKVSLELLKKFNDQFNINLSENEIKKSIEEILKTSNEKSEKIEENENSKIQNLKSDFLTSIFHELSDENLILKNDNPWYSGIFSFTNYFSTPEVINLDEIKIIQKNILEVESSINKNEEDIIKLYEDIQSLQDQKNILEVSIKNDLINKNKILGNDAKTKYQETISRLDNQIKTKINNLKDSFKELNKLLNNKLNYFETIKNKSEKLNDYNKEKITNLNNLKNKLKLLNDNLIILKNNNSNFSKDFTSFILSKNFEGKSQHIEKAIKEGEKKLNEMIENKQKEINDLTKNYTFINSINDLITTYIKDNYWLIELISKIPKKNVLENEIKQKKQENDEIDSIIENLNKKSFKESIKIINNKNTEENFKQFDLKKDVEPTINELLKSEKINDFFNNPELLKNKISLILQKLDNSKINENNTGFFSGFLNFISFGNNEQIIIKKSIVDKLILDKIENNINISDVEKTIKEINKNDISKESELSVLENLALLKVQTDLSLNYYNKLNKEEEIGKLNKELADINNKFDTESKNLLEKYKLQKKTYENFIDMKQNNINANIIIMNYNNQQLQIIDKIDNDLKILQTRKNIITEEITNTENKLGSMKSDFDRFVLNKTEKSNFMLNIQIEGEYLEKLKEWIIIGNTEIEKLESINKNSKELKENLNKENKDLLSENDSDNTKILEFKEKINELITKINDFYKNQKLKLSILSNSINKQFLETLKNKDFEKEKLIKKEKVPENLKQEINNILKTNFIKRKENKITIENIEIEEKEINEIISKIDKNSNLDFIKNFNQLTEHLENLSYQKIYGSYVQRYNKIKEVNNSDLEKNINKTQEEITNIFYNLFSLKNKEFKLIERKKNNEQNKKDYYLSIYSEFKLNLNNSENLTLKVNEIKENITKGIQEIENYINIYKISSNDEVWDYLNENKLKLNEFLDLINKFEKNFNEKNKINFEDQIKIADKKIEELNVENENIIKSSNIIEEFKKNKDKFFSDIFFKQQTKAIENFNNFYKDENKNFDLIFYPKNENTIEALQNSLLYTLSSLNLFGTKTTQTNTKEKEGEVEGVKEKIERVKEEEEKTKNENTIETPQNSFLYTLSSLNPFGTKTTQTNTKEKEGEMEGVKEKEEEVKKVKEKKEEIEGVKEEEKTITETQNSNKNKNKKKLDDILKEDTIIIGGIRNTQRVVNIVGKYNLLFIIENPDILSLLMKFENEILSRTDVSITEINKIISESNDTKTKIGVSSILFRQILLNKIATLNKYKIDDEVIDELSSISFNPLLQGKTIEKIFSNFRDDKVNIPNLSQENKILNEDSDRALISKYDLILNVLKQIYFEFEKNNSKALLEGVLTNLEFEGSLTFDIESSKSIQLSNIGNPEQRQTINVAELFVKLLIDAHEKNYSKDDFTKELIGWFVSGTGREYHVRLNNLPKEEIDQILPILKSPLLDKIFNEDSTIMNYFNGFASFENIISSKSYIENSYFASSLFSFLK